MKRTQLKFIILILFTATGCKRFLDIPLPVNQITGEAAFANDNAATASVNYIFAQMSAGNLYSGIESMGLRGGLYTDELIPISTSANYTSYYTNALDNTNGGSAWRGLYSNIYTINRAIIGIEASQGVVARKNRLLGESYFARALVYFYLVNLYGTVPLAVTDNYAVNNALPRASQADVYKQIIADATRAKQLLDSAYISTDTWTTRPNTDRARPNKFAAAALLARAYLYTNQWQQAEAEATAIIDQPSVYQLPATESAFLFNSREIIWAIAPQVPGNVIKDAAVFYVRPDTTAQASGTVAVLNPALVNTFEAGDARRANWISATTTVTQGTQYGIVKYKARQTAAAATEHVVMFRLAEMYLIRAEARAKQGAFTGANSAMSDVNAVRARALLGESNAIGEAAVLAAIAKERRLELFTEGHRLFDLRRTGKLDEVMNAIAASKGAEWNTKKQWWPISANDIFANPSLIQTDGYQ